MTDALFWIALILVAYGFMLWYLSWRITNGIDWIRSLTRSEMDALEFRLKREILSVLIKGAGSSAAGGTSQSTETRPR